MSLILKIKKTEILGQIQLKLRHSAAGSVDPEIRVLILICNFNFLVDQVIDRASVSGVIALVQGGTKNF